MFDLSPLFVSAEAWKARAFAFAIACFIAVIAFNVLNSAVASVETSINHKVGQVQNLTNGPAGSWK